MDLFSWVQRLANGYRKKTQNLLFLKKSFLLQQHYLKIVLKQYVAALAQGLIIKRQERPLAIQTP